MPAFRDAGKNGTFFRAGFIAHRNDMGEKLSRFKNIENCLGLFFGDVDPRFLHRFDHKRIQDPRLEASAFRYESVAANMIEPSLRHLAAGAVMNANEKDVGFHPAWTETRSWSTNRNESRAAHDSLPLRAKGEIDELLHQSCRLAVGIKEG